VAAGEKDMKEEKQSVDDVVGPQEGTHPLLDEYPDRLVLVTEFGKSHPNILPPRRARSYIAGLYSQPELIKRIFRKRFGRWFIHVPSLVEYLSIEDSLIRSEVDL